MKAFLERKGIHISVHTYLITALSYMALGLFSSLIIGLIIKTIGEQLNLGIISDAFIEMGTFAMDSKIWGGSYRDCNCLWTEGASACNFCVFI